VRRQFEEISESMMANIDQQTEPTINSLWSDIKTCIIDTATQVCGPHIREKKQSLDDYRNYAENGRKAAV